MKANCRIRPISLFLAGYSSLWVSKEEKRRKWHETCKRKVSLLFVFYTTAPLMRWAKKGKTLNQLRIDCNSQLFFFSPLFLAWPPFVTELSLWINILYFLHENNLSWKWMKKTVTDTTIIRFQSLFMNRLIRGKLFFVHCTIVSKLNRCS